MSAKRFKAAAQSRAFVTSNDNDCEPSGSHCASVPSVLGLMTAGTPIAMELSGTSRVTTAFAPMSTLLPTVIAPRIFAPAPISTLLPIEANHYSVTHPTVVAEFRVATNDDSTEVVDHKIMPNLDLAR